MAIVVTWRRVPDAQHTGSVELRGIAGTPFLYVHPEDQAGGALPSPAAMWVYNHDDTDQDEEAATSFALTVRGHVHYRVYARLALAAGATPLATGLQASGSGTYDAFLSVDPEPDAATAVTVTGTAQVRATGAASLFSRTGMGRAIIANAYLFNGAQEIARARASARIQFPFSTRSASVTVTYPVTIPAGGSVRVAQVTTGPAYEIRRGTSRFSALSQVTIGTQ
jgi:hypothetical protein